MNISDYKKIVKEKLSTKRYKHSVNVSKKATQLSKIHGADKKKAEIAGLLHDIMKEENADNQLKLILNFGIILDDVEINSKSLWHQIAGAVYVHVNLGIKDEDIFNAIRHHTSGRKDMSVLEKVIFIADYISADRDYDGVEYMRELANNNLDAAMVYGLSFSISELLQNEEAVTPKSFEAYNQAVKKINE